MDKIMSNWKAPSLDIDFTDLLEIDSFRVVKDEQYAGDPTRGQNNVTEHWIAHLCDAYLKDEDPEDTDVTGAFDSDEIFAGECAYCNADIPEAIIALWSMLEWEGAADILHRDVEGVRYP